MNFQDALIIVLTTVIGWSLNELSQLFRYSRNDKRLINKILFRLIDLHYTLRMLKDLLERVDKLDEITSEVKRVTIAFLQDKRLNSEELHFSLKEANEELAKINPFLAQDLRIIRDQSSLLRKDSLNVKEDILDTEKFVSISLVSISYLSSQLERFIKQLSFKKSKITWIKFHLSLLKRADTNLGDVIDELHQRIERVKT